MRDEIREQEAALPAGKAALVDARAVRLDQEVLHEGDPNLQRASSSTF
jgi:hypothetical protein